MTISEITSCVSVYMTRGAVEEAVVALQERGFDLQRVSLVGKGERGEQHAVGVYDTGTGIHYQGFQAGFWNPLFGHLAGAGFFRVPGVGTLVAAGPIVSLLVQEIEDIELGGGFSMLGAALYRIGIPRNCIDQYEGLVQAEKLLLTVHGDRGAVEGACDILHCQEQQVAVHTARLASI